MEIVSRMGFKVYPLTTLLAHKQNDSIPEYSMAITVDDGWKGLVELAQPIFNEYNYPWTLYLTTYYVEKRTQVVDVTIQYLLWKTNEKLIDCSKIIPGSTCMLDLPGNETSVFEYLYDHCSSLSSSDKRQNFIDRLAKQLNVSWPEKSVDNFLSLVNESDIKQLAKEKVEIELHTHRHYMPQSSQRDLECELDLNRQCIKALTGREANHLCYPSGDYSERQIVWIRNIGINSGVTCNQGLNESNTDKLLLNRLLDGDDLYNIEFEAEVSGFKPIMRGIWQAITREKHYKDKRTWGIEH